MTGVGVGSVDGDFNYVGVSHYFNTNFALAAQVGERDGEGDSATEYGIEARLQF